jgi:hypothetical protein
MIDLLKNSPSPALEERRQRVRDLVACHSVMSGRMVSLIDSIDRSLRDLTAYVPLWLRSIEKRRALMLSKSAGLPTTPAVKRSRVLRRG